MSTWSIRANPLWQHSNSGDCWDVQHPPLADDLCSIVSLESFLSVPSNNSQGEVPTKKETANEPTTPFKPDQKKLHRDPPDERQGISKQLRWKYWEWPPSPCDSNYCLIPSDTAIPQNRVCVPLLTRTAREKLSFPLSKSFAVKPTAVIFRQNASNGSWDEFAWLRVQNKGKISRRLNLIPPVSLNFNVVWAAALNEDTNVPPGLYVRILIQFIPGPKDAQISDELQIRVDGDGGIVVPLIAVAQKPPELEMEDFSCGCCLVGNRIIKNFNIINRGGSGRFWILSESEFMREFIPLTDGYPDAEVAGESICHDENYLQKLEYSGIENEDHESGGEDECVENSNPPPNSPMEPNTPRLDQLHLPPFLLDPTCFSLKVGQQIKVKISFEPTKPKIYHEKIAMLCDNGEVRWFILKGLGIESKTQKIITVYGENWTLDGENTILDLGELSPHEPLNQKITIRNSSSLPVYFFWVISKVASQASVHFPSSESEDPTSLECGALIPECGKEEPGEFESEEVKEMFKEGIPICIGPHQGLLRGCSSIVCELDAVCPTKLGPYVSRIDLYIQQLSQESLRAMVMMSSQEIQKEINLQIYHSTEKPKKLSPFDVNAYMHLPKFRVPRLPAESTYGLEVHLQSICLQCWFEPSKLTGFGHAFTQTKQKLKFFNSTKYVVELKLAGFETEFCHVTVSPGHISVPPHSQICLKMTLRFQNEGECESGLKGVLKLPYMEIDGFVPMKICSESPTPCEPEPETIEEPLLAVTEDAEDENNVEADLDEEAILGVGEETEEILGDTPQ